MRIWARLNRRSEISRFHGENLRKLGNGVITQYDDDSKFQSLEVLMRKITSSSSIFMCEMLSV